MTGREPAAFNFIDLTQHPDDDDTTINTGSASNTTPVVTMPLLTPKTQPADDEARGAMLRPPPPPPPRHHMQLRHQAGSTSGVNYNIRGSNDAWFRRPDQSFRGPDQTFRGPDYGISDDHCRAYLDQRGGGITESRRRRRHGLQTLQPPPDHDNSVQNDIIAPDPPTDHTNHVSPEVIQSDQAQMALGIHSNQQAQLALASTSNQQAQLALASTPNQQAQLALASTSNQQAQPTLASTSYQQAAAEFDRMKRSQEEARRQRHVIAIREQEAVFRQQRHAALFQAGRQEQAARANHAGHNVHTQSSHNGPAPHPGSRPSLPRPPPPLTDYTPTVTNNVNNMTHGSATVIPGSMNWTAQHRLQRFPAPNLMSNEGRTQAMQRSGNTTQMTIVYASMVNIFNNVSLEMAQAVCTMLAANESISGPPTLISHHVGSGLPASEPNLISQPTVISPQISAPSAPQSPLQAGPSQDAPQAALQAGPSQAAPQSSLQAGPSQAALQSALQAGPSQDAPQSNLQAGPPQAAPDQSSLQAGSSQAAPTGELPHARKASLTRFLDMKKDRIHSKDKIAKEEDDRQRVAIISPRGKSESDQPSGSADQKVPVPVTTPTTPPGTSSVSKRKFAHEEDLSMRGQSGESASVAEVGKTAADYVMREYQAILEELDP